MSGVGERDKDLRNFRAFYYDNLGLRGVEQRKALDLLLKDNEIDLEKLSTFCLQFGLPAFRRPMVWKLLLGVLPRHQESHKFVIEQQAEQVEDLLRTLKIIRKLSVRNDSIPSQIVKMYLLNEGEFGFTQPCKELEKKLKILTSMAKLMCETFENISDCFCVTVKFFKLQETFSGHMKTLPDLVEQRLSAEDNELWKHLNCLEVMSQLPWQKWFESCFAEDLNDASLERVWDKIVAGSCAILVYVAVAILLVHRTVLIQKKTSESVLRSLSQIPRERCEAIVGKAIDLHVKYGSTLSPNLTGTPKTSLRDVPANSQDAS